MWLYTCIHHLAVTRCTPSNQISYYSLPNRKHRADHRDPAYRIIKLIKHCLDYCQPDKRNWMREQEANDQSMPVEEGVVTHMPLAQCDIIWQKRNLIYLCVRTSPENTAALNGLYELIADITRACMSSGAVVKLQSNLVNLMENALASWSLNP